jgi:hypothetical protein
MGRLGVLVVAVTLTLVGWSARADAHICPYSAQIPVGRSSTVPVYVTVESEATPDVEVDVPPELHLERAGAPKGWTFTRKGQILRFRGPAFSPFTCPSFAIVITAPTKGVYPISVVQRDAHGNVTRRTTTDPKQRLSPGYAPTVYAGVKPPSTSSGTSLSSTTIAGIALLAAGVLMAIALVRRARRARREDEREGELQDRLDEFRKQTRDRSAGPRR